jgi:sterol desaturase/sphingolipid hydroxylase (fatty acid hydroxylase superfamily)
VISLLPILNKSIYILAPIALLETFYFYYTSKKSIDLKETFSNVTIGLVGKFLKTFFTGNVLFLFLSPFQNYALFSLGGGMAAFCLTLLVADFVYYWNHRLSHEIRLFWSYHSVHHSSPHFNLSTAVRLPWLGTHFDGIFYIPIVLLGFDPALILISKAVILLYQFWIHSEAIGSLGWFDGWFNSPANHRVHHGSNPIYLDKNHGGILMIWDRLFGTYEKENEPVQYGLTKPIGSKNPIYINFYEPYRILVDLFQKKGFRSKMKVLFGPPG